MSKLITLVNENPRKLSSATGTSWLVGKGTRFRRMMDRQKIELASGLAFQSCRFEIIDWILAVFGPMAESLAASSLILRKALRCRIRNMSLPPQINFPCATSSFYHELLFPHPTSSPSTLSLHFLNTHSQSTHKSPPSVNLPNLKTPPSCVSPSPLPWLSPSPLLRFPRTTITTTTPTTQPPSWPLFRP